MTRQSVLVSFRRRQLRKKQKKSRTLPNKRVVGFFPSPWQHYYFYTFSFFAYVFVSDERNRGEDTVKTGYYTYASNYTAMAFMVSVSNMFPLPPNTGHLLRLAQYILYVIILVLV
jgi:hypothetical protein